MTVAEATVVVELRCPWCDAFLGEYRNVTAPFTVRVKCHGNKGRHCGRWVEREIKG